MASKHIFSCLTPTIYSTQLFKIITLRKGESEVVGEQRCTNKPSNQRKETKDEEYVRTLHSLWLPMLLRGALASSHTINLGGYSQTLKKNPHKHKSDGCVASTEVWLWFFYLFIFYTAFLASTFMIPKNVWQ